MRVLAYGMVGTNRGGIETFLKKMNMNMSSDTIFDYVIEGHTCIHENEICSLGGKVFFISQRNRNPLKNIFDNYKLLRDLKGSVDVVYFNLSSLSWIAPIIIARHLGYRVFVHSHNSQFIAANSGFLYRIVNCINKKWLSHMNVTRLSCSKPATQFMFEPQDQVEMIFNAIKTSQFAFDKTIRERVRKELKIREKSVVGFVGRLSDQKNPLFLPDIMSALLKRCENAVMLIIGDGDMRSQLEKKIAILGLTKQCRVLGNRTDVNEIMQAMDVFLLPSEHEGLPYVVIEAQTAGLKCVVSDVITDEVNVSGNVHFLSLNCGVEVWAENLINCLKNPVSDRRKMADFMAATDFNIENEAKRLEKILRGPL